ncbi:RNA-binding S4 domain-containing protein [Azoarcus sp. KH32C]|uniref:RNA-binding S4 domain-containing protein n=1 Tax=Azoarcus sp. KH32C TaxID=748247 RepID=UPI0002386BAF|nr:RNA-binding S4 domain-containing protein [Azoarcus sp. KH32C]BAL25971.1 heat shock protein [Azoarcus sp. KH32C]
MNTTVPASAQRMRIDKWLWAARFYKTRSVASEAIDGGHVRLNGTAPKPSRDVRPGDMLDITVGNQTWTVRVLGLNEQRRPAPEARLLYEETPESTARRETEREARALAPTPGSDLRGRPTKKARRQLRGFNEGF